MPEAGCDVGQGITGCAMGNLVETLVGGFGVKRAEGFDVRANLHIIKTGEYSVLNVLASGVQGGSKTH